MLPVVVSMAELVVVVVDDESESDPESSEQAATPKADIAPIPMTARLLRVAMFMTEIPFVSRGLDDHADRCVRGHSVPV